MAVTIRRSIADAVHIAVGNEGSRHPFGCQLLPVDRRSTVATYYRSRRPSRFYGVRPHSSYVSGISGYFGDLHERNDGLGSPDAVKGSLSGNLDCIVSTGSDIVGHSDLDSKLQFAVAGTVRMASGVYNLR